MGAEPAAHELTGAGSAGDLTLFRYCGDESPFWAVPNSRPGRWNSAGEQPTQYWSSSPDAAWAELIRFEGLGTEADLDLVRMPIWACRFPAEGLVDLRNVAVRDTVGFSEADLVDDDWSACQRLGSVLRESQEGVIAASAVLEGHANVTIFGARRMIDWRERPVLASAVPACVMAVGRPRPGLIEALAADRLQPPNGPA